MQYTRDKNSPTGFSRIYPISSWGEPAQIAQAKIDKECPICGAKPDPEVGMDFIYKGREPVAGVCHVCKWSFTQEETA